MIIKNITEEIKGLDGGPLGKYVIDLEKIIKQVKVNGDIEALLKSLEKTKKEQKADLTYLVVLENACFTIHAKETENAGKLTDDLALAGKLRAESEINKTQIDDLRKGVLQSNYDPMVKAMALNKLEGESSPSINKPKSSKGKNKKK